MTAAVCTTVVTAPWLPAGAADHSATTSVDPAPLDWQIPHSSAESDPADLVDPMAVREPARVIVLSQDAGRLTVDTVSTRGESATEDVVAQAQERPGVLAVGIDHRVHATADPLQDRQWGLTEVDAAAAWRVTRGAGAVVAVVDSGVDGSHPDLAGALVRGVNTRTDRGDYSAPTVDRDGHGTHVAGIIAARSANGQGVAGVAPKASIMPVKVLDADGSGWMGDVVEGIVWAADHGADVINMSLGGPDADFSATAVAYARAKGVVVVAAAGNESSSAPSYPAALPGVVSVTALERGGSVDSYSNYGATVDLAAPGTGIVSTVPGGYAAMSGTSMASPQVAGVAALVASVAPRAAIEAVLTRSADDQGAPGWDSRFGAGVVDAAAAVRMACPTCAAVDVVESPAQPVRLSTTVPRKVKVGASKALPATNAEGTPVDAWKSRTSKRCSITPSDTGSRVVGKVRGRCTLVMKVTGMKNEKHAVRVTGR